MLRALEVLFEPRAAELLEELSVGVDLSSWRGPREWEDQDLGKGEDSKLGEN